jgi:hypothetical protein
MSISIPPSYLRLFSQAIKNAKQINLKYTTWRPHLLMEEKKPQYVYLAVKKNRGKLKS